MQLRAPLVALILVAAAGGAPRPDVPPILPNDNLRPAGRLDAGVLHLELEARVGRWHPDRPGDPGVVAYTFAEPGRAPTIPAPLLRVPAGTEVRLRLRNALADVPVSVHGFGARPLAAGAMPDTIHLDPGAVRDVRFRLDSAGTWFYWGAIDGRRPRTNPGGRVAGRPVERDADEPMAGAIVVDPPGTRGPPADRVLVISTWEEPGDTADTGIALREVMAINGRSWPHTERLEGMVGDTVRWRVVNTSFQVHPMHLHGFYYRVDRIGGQWRDSAVARGRGEMVVTSTMAPLSTMALTWVPERPGNWLFHCHVPKHVLPHLPLAPGRVSPAEAEAFEAGHSRVHAGANHALGGMGGLVMGVRVRATGAAPLPATAVAHRPARSLRLLAQVDTTEREGPPAYRFALSEGGTGPSPGIVLARGEPVRITVVNRLREPTAVHWHGIELESFFDGVAGFSGAGTQVTPVIQPGDSFEARFTPPRAGTFIYHTHVNERRQMRAGLTGALVVLEGGRALDTEHDIVVLVTTPRRPTPRPAVLINGSERPPSLELRSGTRYRLRLINITVDRPGLRLALRSGDSTLATWRPLAKDGADLPPERRVIGPAKRPLGTGETFDVELRPMGPGALRLEAETANGVRLGSVPLVVR